MGSTQRAVFRVLALITFCALPSCGSSPGDATTPMVDLAAPAGLAASAGNGGVTLSWNAATGATGYKVYYGTSSTSLNPSVISTGTKATIGSLTNGTTYYFAVSSTAGPFEGLKSSTVSATPTGTSQEVILSAPTGLAAAVGDKQISLAWNAVTGALSYKAYYGTAQDQLTTTLAVTTTTVTVTGLTNGTTYYFGVAAISGSTESAKSVVVSAKPTDVADTTAPTFAGLSAATATSASQIDLAWTAAADNVSMASAIVYKICQSTTSGTCGASFTATYTTSVGVTSYSATGLSAGTAYYFVAHAVDEAGNADSNTLQKSATTKAPSFGACNSQAFECCVTEAYDCMIAIPAGTFVQGSKSGEGDTDEKPRRLVTLSNYYIDKYEVTNANFKACVTAGECTAPSGANSYTRTTYYGNATYDNYPVIKVNHLQGVDYCRWKGRRLPTEAEWEKAARGPADGSLVGLTSGQCTSADAAGTGRNVNCNLRPYPWGGTITSSEPYATGADCTNGNVSSDCVGDTSLVGSYPTGASPYGVLDMAGNVFEWVKDGYDSAYYASAPSTDPPGPTSGTTPVWRGGSWAWDSGSVRSADRNSASLQFTKGEFGFRCSRTP
ncbi:MAG: SUMF1/EgtB/PvdO family nonheme iron enzyme [Nitrospirae bacterium]|nr:SUMF1/EgtB/PvdO family nonheme iron enzyme [Nitrospirota bacterium]